MGYRHYFVTAKRDTLDEIRCLSIGDLTEYAKSIGKYEDDYISMTDGDFWGGATVYELGKLYWDDTAERIYNTGITAFDNCDTQEYFADYKPYIVDKAGLVEAIKIYSEKALRWYQNLLEDGMSYEIPFGLTVQDDDIKSPTKIKQFIDERIRDWERGVVNVNTEYDAITSSWDYEYAVFQLAHLLHIIDWEKYTLLFYGW